MRAIPSTFKDLTGQRFGRVTVLGIGRRNNGLYWRCRCDCGTETTVKGTSLRNGTTKSCGCESIEAARRNVESRFVSCSMFPHSAKLKDLYANMKRRCYDPSNKRWEHYGGKGVAVCDEWLNDSVAFYKWATENGYSPGLQIDRIDVSGNYTPGNCRFVNAIVQMNNTTRNRWLTWNGRTQTVAMWAREIGVRGMALQHRVDRNWPLERIFTQPFRRQNRA